MKFINEWEANAKQGDKYRLLIRFGKLTILEFYLDSSLMDYEITLLNLTLKK
jgi:hypothetical protein